MKLSERIRQLENEWIEEHKEGAQSRAIESQLILSQFLLTGAGAMPKNVNLALDYLKTAAKRSPDACLKLGKLYLKGSKTRQNYEKAYFYLRVATLFRCRCGTFAEKYHSREVSNPHLCYPTEATALLNKIPSQDEYEERFKEQFNAWKRV